MSKPAPKQSPKPAARRPRRGRGGITINIPPNAARDDDEREEELEQEEQQDENLDDNFVDPTEEALESIFTEARGHSGVEIRVYKLDPENRAGARAYCMSVPLADAEGGRLLDTLQRKWKGGEFELMARADGRIVKRATIVVLPLPEEHGPAIQSQEQMAQVINAAMAPIQQVITELRSRPQMSFESLLTKGAMVLPLLQNLRALLAPPSAAPAAASDPLAMLMQMKQLRKAMEAAGLSDREPDTFDRMLTMFDTIGKPLLEKIELAQQKAGQRGAPVRRGPAVAAPPTVAGAGVMVPGAPVVAPPSEVVAPQIPESFMPYLPLLAMAAKSGDVPEEFAQRILSAVPDEMIDDLADAIEDGSLVSALLAKPEFAGTESWLKAVAASILAGISSEDDEPGEGADTDVSGQDDGNAAGGAG